MRPLVTAFALGFLAGAFVAFVTSLSLSLIADANDWGSFTIGIGALVLLEFERTPTSTAASFGPAIALVGVVGGLLNAAGAALLARRI